MAGYYGKYGKKGGKGQSKMAGCGGGKGYGKKGGVADGWGAAPSWSEGYAESWAAPWASPGGGASEVEHIGRIKTAYQFTKAALRGAADADGSCLNAYADGASRAKIGDKNFLTSSNLAKALTAENCHLVRRPGVGLSEFAASVVAGVDVLEKAASDEGPLKLLAKKFGDKPGVIEALKVLDTVGYKGPRSEQGLKDAVNEIFNLFRDDRKLYELFARSAVAASRIYIASMQALQLGALLSDPGAWAEGVPKSISPDKKLGAWARVPADKAKLAACMAQLVAEKLARDEGKGEGGNGKDILDDWGDAPEDEAEQKDKTGESGASEASGDESSEEGEKKKKKKKQGKGAKAKKDKQGGKQKKGKKEKAGKRKASKRKTSDDDSDSDKDSSSDAGASSAERSKKAKKEKAAAEKEAKKAAEREAQEVAEAFAAGPEVVKGSEEEQVEEGAETLQWTAEQGKAFKVWPKDIIAKAEERVAAFKAAVGAETVDLPLFRQIFDMVPGKVLRAVDLANIKAENLTEMPQDAEALVEKASAAAALAKRYWKAVAKGEVET